PDVPQRWWPDWNNPLLWLMGITLGANNAQFYAANGFIPDYLNAMGQGELISATLSWLNGSQIVASFLVLATSERLQRQTWPFTICAPLSVLSLAGILFGHGYWVLLSATIFGFATAVSFLVTFGLPAIFSAPGDAHRVAG